MPKNKLNPALAQWLASHPELCEKLNKIRELEADAPGLDKAELELLELTKAMGATSFARILQSKSDAISGQKRQDPNMRIHGKKN